MESSEGKDFCWHLGTTLQIKSNALPSCRTNKCYNTKISSDTISPKIEIISKLMYFCCTRRPTELHMYVQRIHTKMTALYLDVILNPTSHLYSDFWV